MSLPGGITEDDFRILEFIASRDMIADPKIVESNLDIGHARVKNRMQSMLKRGFLKRPDEVPEGLSAKGLYEVTKLGEAYARGDMTVAELREIVKKHDVDE